MTKGGDITRQSSRPSTRPTSFGRPSSFNTRPMGVTGRPSRMETMPGRGGPPSNQTSSTGRPSMMHMSHTSSRPSSSLNKSASGPTKGFDEYSSSEMRDTHAARQTYLSKEEFARCTIDSSSTHRSNYSDYSS